MRHNAFDAIVKISSLETEADKDKKKSNGRPPNIVRRLHEFVHVPCILNWLPMELTLILPAPLQNDYTAKVIPKSWRAAYINVSSRQHQWRD